MCGEAAHHSSAGHDVEGEFPLSATPGQQKRRVSGQAIDAQQNPQNSQPVSNTQLRVLPGTPSPASEAAASAASLRSRLERWRSPRPPTPPKKKQQQQKTIRPQESLSAARDARPHRGGAGDDRGLQVPERQIAEQRQRPRPEGAASSRDFYRFRVIT